jgi:hypothetical protein
MKESLKKYLLIDKKSRGQTLIEAVATVGIALVVITSIVALVNASNRRATLARQSNQASKLAQEGMEIVRNIRDVNGDELVRAGTSTDNPICSSGPDYCRWSGLYTVLQGSQLAYLEFDCNGEEEWCLLDPSPDIVPPSTSEESSLLDIFTRVVRIEDNEISATENYVCSELQLPGQDVKRVTLTVSWQSPIGAQKREVTSCIADL